MAANRNRRLQKEINDILNDAPSGVSLTTTSDDQDFKDLTHFKGHFRGPPDTPYEDGHYEVDILITSDYPFKPPVMRFITKIWHPNVSSQTGAICLDTLKDAWSPVLTLKSALISLQSLLSSPEPKDPQDAEVASMLLSKPDEFAHVARQWAIKYAGAPKPAAGSHRTGAGGSVDEGVAEQDGAAWKKSADRERRKAEERAQRQAYRGYNKRMVEKFTQMGFQVDQVVAAFEYVGIDPGEGEEYELEEEFYGDVTARLFGEM